MQNNSIIIMAAGKGTRMRSNLPKVLHKLAGKPLLHWVIDNAYKTKPKKLVVIHGFRGDQLINSCQNRDYIAWVEQKEQLGTGHAIKQALSEIKNTEQTIILSGDVPLVNVEIINKLSENIGKNEIGVLTCKVENPFGLGRVIRNNNNDVVEIVEEKDANDEIKKINEINSGIYIFPTKFLMDYLEKLSNKNAQQEYYLTDLIAMAAEDNITVKAIEVENERLIQGINDRFQLQELERYVQLERAKKLMLSGVTICDANRIDIRTDDIEIENDICIDINVILEGQIKIGKGTIIGANTVIKNSQIGENVNILENSVIDGAEIHDNCSVGPFARIRPKTTLLSHAKVGNFVEIKKATVGEKSKVNHLSYIGDSLIGNNVNIGAGTITCNYDGFKKYETVIEDDVFIGSDTQIIAPIKIGRGATVAAGTTIMKNVDKGTLVLNQKTQKAIENWQRSCKKEEKV